MPEYQGEPDEISIQKCREAARQVLALHLSSTHFTCPDGLGFVPAGDAWRTITVGCDFKDLPRPS